MHEYENVRRVSYGEEGAQFVPVCKTCGRFVKAPETMSFNEKGPKEPHTECKKCGPTAMLFEGFY
jgi:ribosomal protein L32